MPGRFKIYLRRRQNQAQIPAGTGPVVNVVVQCNPSNGYAEYVAGNVDNSTPWVNITPENGWYDFTEFIEGSEKISLTWDKVNTGDSTAVTTNEAGSNYDKGISTELLFRDKAQSFIENWLAITECQILNSVEVKIIDLVARNSQMDPAGNYRIFEIKSDNIEEAPYDEPCQYKIKLREQDGIWHCVHKTFIWDNHQNWFIDTGTKQHPCFLTCIEPRPRLVNSVRMALLLAYYSFLQVSLGGLFGVVGMVLRVFNIGASLTTDGLLQHARKVLNANRFVDAPLIRDYIQNAADKCDLNVDTIFDQGQEWENLCLYYPQAGFMHESDGDEDTDHVSPALFYHFDNRWNITIAELLDKLKPVFAAEWYVTPLNTLVFKHTKDLINLDPIYDFTLPGAEPIRNLRYKFNGNKKPAYGRYQYSQDGSDIASQEMSTLYNDIVDYDGPQSNNPMLEGERVKNFEFAPTGFVRDGRARDYLRLLIRDGEMGAKILLFAFIIIVVALLGFPTTGAGIALGALIIATIGKVVINATALETEFVTKPTYTGAVRLTAEQTMIPRLLLWDGLNLNRAKVDARGTMPAPAPFYNPEMIAYDIKNSINIDNPGLNLYNYPLYFDGDFTGNMFDKYHDTLDNPLKSLETHRQVSWSVDLCEGMLNLFGVFQNQYAQIGKIVKLESKENYDVYARLENIAVDYESGDINLRGVVLRRKLAVAPVPPPEVPGTVSPHEPPVEELVCLYWLNDSEDPAINVVYEDCTLAIITASLAPGERFCARQIFDLGTGGNIVATDTCETDSPSGPPPEPVCYNYQNIGLNDAINVNYTDCDGNIITGATIPAQSAFCARSVESFGTCGVIVQVGPCDTCEESGDTNLRRWR